MALEGQAEDEQVNIFTQCLPENSEKKRLSSSRLAQLYANDKQATTEFCRDSCACTALRWVVHLVLPSTRNHRTIFMLCPTKNAAISQNTLQELDADYFLDILLRSHTDKEEMAL